MNLETEALDPTLSPEATALILGAVFDFVLHCAGREMPLVIGKGYTRDKFFEEFEIWAKGRQMPLTKIDIDCFRLLTIGTK